MTFNVLISNSDDHLRNHRFVWVGAGGWTLSPAYDLNPSPVDIRPRILSTNITVDESTCDLELVLEAAEYFGLGLPEAKGLIRKVAEAVSTWRDTARGLGARPREVERVSSAFDHADLHRALGL